MFMLRANVMFKFIVRVELVCLELECHLSLFYAKLSICVCGYLIIVLLRLSSAQMVSKCLFSYELSLLLT